MILLWDRHICLHPAGGRRGQPHSCRPAAEPIEPSRRRRRVQASCDRAAHTRIYRDSSCFQPSSAFASALSTRNGATRVVITHCVGRLAGASPGLQPLLFTVARPDHDHRSQPPQAHDTQECGARHRANLVATVKKSCRGVTRG